MLSDERLEQLAARLGRPAQSLQAFAAQPPAVLDLLLQGIEEAKAREQAQLEHAYATALPAWLKRLVIPWLRRRLPA